MLSVKDLFVAYGQSEALHGISFEAAPKETVAIMGRNGMGKTTLFKTLMGIVPVEAGAIEVDAGAAEYPAHAADAEALVNTVNCVGIMGRGIGFY